MYLGLCTSKVCGTRHLAPPPRSATPAGGGGERPDRTDGTDRARGSGWSPDEIWSCHRESSACDAAWIPKMNWRANTVWRPRKPLGFSASFRFPFLMRRSCSWNQATGCHQFPQMCQENNMFGEYFWEKKNGRWRFKSHDPHSPKICASIFLRTGSFYKNKNNLYSITPIATGSLCMKPEVHGESTSPSVSINNKKSHAPKPYTEHLSVFAKRTKLRGEKKNTETRTFVFVVSCIKNWLHILPPMWDNFFTLFLNLKGQEVERWFWVQHKCISFQ